MPNESGGKRNSAFWNFSLEFYARPRAAGACLELQDSAGVDVNLLLYLLFLANHLRTVCRDDVARLDELVATWRERTVLPLRALRRELKTGIAPIPVIDSEPLRSAIKRDELEAERVEQELLEQRAPVATLGLPAASRDAAARANLAAYASFLNGLPEAPVAILLDAFAQAA
jgi:uncharacterized protein (TIGR02444 family)